MIIKNMKYTLNMFRIAIEFIDVVNEEYQNMFRL